MDTSSDQYGSNATLNSDSSSLAGARRPSVETISTYLSQDSINDDAASQNSQEMYFTYVYFSYLQAISEFSFLCFFCVTYIILCFKFCYINVLSKLARTSRASPILGGYLN